MKEPIKVRFKITKTSDSEINAIAGYNENGLVIFDRFQADSLYEMRKAKGRILDRFEMITPYEHIEDKEGETKEVH